MHISSRSYIMILLYDYDVSSRSYDVIVLRVSSRSYDITIVLYYDTISTRYNRSNLVEILGVDKRGRVW